MLGIDILAILAGGLAGLGLVERAAHFRNLSRVPIRIHVSGTRGKSSVTRLIAAALNDAGIPAAAKTTGTLARMIMPDFREIPVYRPTGANIIEQKRIVDAAVEAGAKALVVECMALQPYLHWVAERMLVRATHGVITNARPDHLDVMGPTDADVARALAGMVPVGGVLYTAEQKHLDVLKEACDDRKTRLVATTAEEIEAVSDMEMSGFSYTEHKENVALVLKLTEEFKIPRQAAIKGMWKANPDPGALSEHVVHFFGRRIVFVNGFAANDPHSTERIWRYARKRYHDVDRVVGIFNLRADRPSRTAQLVRDGDYWREADKVVLIGTGAYLFARLAANLGVGPELFVQVESSGADEIFERVLEVCGRSTLVVGMGNIGGPGLDLVRYFKNRSLEVR
ncbi:MAG: poly-gamma-glutamate synthase PgsB [Myxococcales bacterium]|nr:MAG: poly-gamma-glutamate synthase PgsB [Myxococcales bacterium]